MTIFGGIVSGIVWLVGPAFSVAEVPSPSEILIVDQHPTRVIIDRVEVSRLSDASEEYVVAWLKNVSDVTAINVEAEFMSAGGDALTVGENISNAWRLGRLSIPPGEELLVPIAPLSEYLRLAQNIYPHARLFEFSPPESLGGFTLRDRVCGLADSFGCDFASRSIPTAVTLEYGTVFGGTVEISTFFSGIFLLSEPSE
ncbi:MAG: hypothetical protein DHS20C11_19860 [Lysobacteraceae bacterium]|nr:MAG: hypothetical protein DHS20C11_19860 [Xanthomonadaceae bacterium]